ncbi:MAG: GTP-binding protein [Omnitrophica bacterium]|nr:GTP-binding protein [Candidatus Omnitrophota bacterium]
MRNVTKKKPIKIAIIGHVDHGKSTLIGRLLLDTHSLSRDRLAEIKRISKELGKDTELAFLTDQLEEEREKNITIDTTQIFFRTRQRDYVIIDTPGHLEFIKNMITGTSLAEAAILIVDITEGIQEQTRRHAYLASSLGVERLVVVFNKMDLTGYAQDSFIREQNLLSAFLKNMGITAFHIVPVSAKKGDNISRRSPRLGWYKGPTLIESIDRIEADVKNRESVLRFPVQDIYEIEGESVLVGRMLSGTMRAGQEIAILPGVKKTTIKAIRVFGRLTGRAERGESIGLILDGSMAVKRGDVIAEKEYAGPAKNSFRGNIFWMSEMPLELEKKITLRCATQEIEGVAEKIENRMDSSSLRIIEENARVVRKNEAATVTFRTQGAIVTEKFSFIKELGRFVIERKNCVEGAGVVV